MNYRENYVSPRDIRMINDLGFIAIDILRVCDVDKKSIASGSYEDYKEWIFQWKDFYKRISNIIRELKDDKTPIHQPTNHAMLEHLKRLASTMLNARQFAKDVRKNVHVQA